MKSLLSRDLKTDYQCKRSLRELASQHVHYRPEFTDDQIFQFLEVEKILDEFYARKASLMFDGESLSWIEQGKSKQWPAWSGREGYWSPEFQALSDTGPIPSGVYEVRQNELYTWESTPLWNRALCVLNLIGQKRGKWPGCTPAWGTRKISLIPKPNTKTFGRGGFTLHGGMTPGSAGCIDITNNIENFTEFFRLYGKDLLLEVRYKPLHKGTGYHNSKVHPR